MTIGENIKKIRKEKGIKQEELAAALGVSTMTIGRYETCASVPRMQRINEIAAALEVSPFELFKGVTVDFTQDNKTKNNINKQIILDAFEQLNGTGKRIAAQRIQELTLIEQYTRPEPQADEEQPQEQPYK